MTTQKPSDKGRRPTIRPTRVAGAIGIACGIVAGIAFALLTAAAGATHGSSETKPYLDATHLPPLLTRPGEAVELRYDVYCVPVQEDQNGTPCDAVGRVFVRPGNRGSYREISLHVDPTALEGRHVAVVPADVATADEGFTYYAVFQTTTGDTTMTLPAGGPSAPQRSVRLDRPVEVSLGSHTFGVTRRADARVFEASWGDGLTEVGLESGRNLPPIGASSFDVDNKRTVHVLDQAHRRLMRWSLNGSGPVAIPLAIDGTIADLAVGSDGSVYVLESAREGRRPVLRTFGEAGELRGTVELAERTASQVRLGPRGPIVLQHPSGQWMAMEMESQLVPESAQKAAGRPGRALPDGGEVVVLRRGAEIRVLSTGANGTRRGWRVTSATPVAEVQLAEPLGKRLLLVMRLYTDEEDEFVALVLGAQGLLYKASVTSADWAETAPLSRFRLVGSSLYQLGSTPAGVFVDRYDLGAK